MIIVKNVILYDPNGHVSGYVELKTGRGGTQVKVKHNLSDRDLLVSVVVGGESHVLTMTDRTGDFDLKDAIDLTREVMICLMRRDGNTVNNLATGVINLAEKKQKAPLATIIEETSSTPISREKAAVATTGYNTVAAKEVDELLRKVCAVDAEGKGICEKCPYREFFYGENYVADNEAVDATDLILSKPQ